jgi:hypothetical protein
MWVALPTWLGITAVEDTVTSQSMELQRLSLGVRVQWSFLPMTSNECLAL